MSEPAQDLLERHARFVRGLARSLVVDDATAADVAQETWLRFVRRPPEFGRPVRPWLATVVRNLVRRGHRDALRRDRRERAAASAEALPSAADGVAKEEILEGVVAEVRALAQPYRRTVLQHYYEGLSYAEIARSQNIAVETVRSRLKRARALMQARLDQRFGKRRTWVAGLALLLGTRSASAAVQATIAACLLVGVLLWTTAGGIGRARAPDPPASSTGAPHATAMATSKPAPAEVLPAAPERSAVWEIVARDGSGAPVAGLALWARNADGNLIWTHTDAQGIAHFVHQGDSLLVHVHSPDSSAVRQQRLVRASTVLTLEQRLPVDVYLIDGTNGRVLAGGSVTCAGPHPIALVRRADHFRHASAPALPGYQFEAAFDISPPPGYANPGRITVHGPVSRYARSLRVDIPLRQNAEFIIRRGADDPHVSGEVTVANGWTTLRGTVHLQGESFPIYFSSQRRGENGVVESIVVFGAALSAKSRQDAMRLSAAHVRSFEIQRGGASSEPGTIVAVARRADGTPVPHALVRFRDGVEMRADAQGRVERVGVAPGWHTLEMREAGLVPARAAVQVPPRGVARAELLEPRGREVAVRVENEAGAPVTFAPVTVALAGGTPYVHIVDGVQFLSLHTDSHGELLLRGLPAWKLTVTAGEHLVVQRPLAQEE